MVEFEFVIDDNTTYYLLSDFKSPKAKLLFQSYRQLEKDYLQQEDKLNGLRQQYASANQQGKEKLAPAILDLEKRILQMNEELDALGVSVRNAEKQIKIIQSYGHTDYHRSHHCCSNTYFWLNCLSFRGLAWLAFQHLLVFSMPTITLSPIWVWQEDLSL